MEVCADTVSIEVCTTSTSKEPVGLRDNIAVRKSDELTKNPSWFVNTKVYSLLDFLSSRREERNRVWTLSRPRLLDKEKQNVMRRENAHLDLGLSFTFSLVVLTRASIRGLSSPLRVRAPTVVFTSSCPAANWLSLPHRVRPLTISLLSLLSHPLLDSIFIWVSFSQS